PNGFDRCNNVLSVAAITNANPGQVTVTSNNPVTSLNWSAGVVTGVLDGSHNSVSNNFLVGDTPLLRISGAAQAGYNGDFTCTITSVVSNGAVGFTYPLASNPGTSPATGTITWGGHGFVTGDIINH